MEWFKFTCTHGHDLTLHCETSQIYVIPKKGLKYEVKFIRQLVMGRAHIVNRTRLAIFGISPKFGTLCFCSEYTQTA